MKTQLAFLALAMSTMPFTFWELESYVGSRKISMTLLLEQDLFIKPMSSLLIEKQNNGHNNLFEDNLYFFLYDKSTKYRISYILNKQLHNQELNNKIFNLFLKQEKLTDIQNKNLIFYLTKERLDFNVIPVPSLLHKYNIGLNSSNRLESNEAIQKKAIELQKEYKIQPFQVQSTFTTSSGVTIDNISEGNVKINMVDKQPLGFQTILLNYFDTHTKYTDFAEKLGHSPTSKTLELLKSVPETNQLAFQKLQNCTILEVYTVRLNEKGQNSIIWGSAQENTKTKEEPKKFHWITELDHDIADVLKEYYAKYVKPS